MLRLAVVPWCIEFSLAWYRNTFWRESEFFFCGWQIDDINVTYVRPMNAILNSTGNRNLTKNLSQQKQFCLLVRPGPKWPTCPPSLSTRLNVRETKTEDAAIATRSFPKWWTILQLTVLHEMCKFFILTYVFCKLYLRFYWIKSI